MTYHLDWTVFLFAHTIAEVLDLAAFVLVFAGAVYADRARRPALRRPGDDAGPPRRRRVLAAIVVAAGCGGTGASTPVATTEVTMAKSYRFDPKTIEVKAGATVTWTNDDNFTHTVQGRRPGRPQGRAAATASRSAFDKPGTLPLRLHAAQPRHAREVIVK